MGRNIPINIESGIQIYKYREGQQSIEVKNRGDPNKGEYNEEWYRSWVKEALTHNINAADTTNHFGLCSIRGENAFNITAHKKENPIKVHTTIVISSSGVMLSCYFAQIFQQLVREGCCT